MGYVTAAVEALASWCSSGCTAVQRVHSGCTQDSSFGTLCPAGAKSGAM